MNESTYQFTLRVRDVAGVLVRVAQVFARRGCNISSMHVVPHGDDVWSDMKITVRNVGSVDQIIHQLQKLIDVQRVHMHEELKR